jgi:hypothetical protein
MWEPESIDLSTRRWETGSRVDGSTRGQRPRAVAQDQVFLVQGLREPARGRQVQALHEALAGEVPEGDDVAVGVGDADHLRGLVHAEAQRLADHPVHHLGRLAHGHEGSVADAEGDAALLRLG